MLKFQRWIFCINNHKLINSFESQSVKRLVWNNIDKIARPLLCCDGTNIIFAYLYTFYVIIEFRLWAVINICITAITHLVERAKKLQNTAKLFRPGSNTCTIFLADSSRSSGGGTSSQLRWLSLPFSACHTHATSARAHTGATQARSSLCCTVYTIHTPHPHRTFAATNIHHTRIHIHIPLLCTHCVSIPPRNRNIFTIPTLFLPPFSVCSIFLLSSLSLAAAASGREYIYIYSVRGLSCGIGAAASLPSTTSSSPERARESERAQRAASAQSSASGAPSAGYARSQRRAPVSKRGEENGEERWWKVTRERERGRSGFAAPEQRPIGQFLAGSSRTRSA